MALFKRRLRSPKGWNEIATVVIEMQEVLESWAHQIGSALLNKQNTLRAGEGIVLSGDTISVSPVPRGEYSFSLGGTYVAFRNVPVLITVNTKADSYRWQSKSGTAGWRDVTSADAATETVSFVSAVSSDVSIRCRLVTDGVTSYSSEFLIHII